MGALATIATSEELHLSALGVVVDPHNPQRVYALLGSPAGDQSRPRWYQLYVSQDGGERWQAAWDSSPQLQPDRGYGSLENVIAFDPTTPGVSYAGGEKGLFKTTDAGNTWQAVTMTLPISQVLDIAVAPSDPDEVYVLVQPAPDLDAQSAVLASADGGESVDLVHLFADTRLSSIAIDTVDANSVIVGGEGVYRSINGGATWRELGAPTHLWGVTDVAIHPADARQLYVASNGRLWQSGDDGETWHIARQKGGNANSYPDTSFYAWGVAISPRPPHPVFVAAGGRGVETFTPSHLLGLDTGRWRTTSRGLAVDDSAWIRPGNVLRDLFFFTLWPGLLVFSLGLVAAHGLLLVRSQGSGGEGMSIWRGLALSATVVGAALAVYLAATLFIISQLAGTLIMPHRTIVRLFAGGITLVATFFLTNSVYKGALRWAPRRRRGVASMFALSAVLVFTLAVAPGTGYFVY